VITEFLSAASQTPQYPFTVTFLVMALPRIAISHPVTQGVIEQHGQLAGGRGHRFGLADPRRQAPVKSTQSRRRFADVHRRQTEQRAGPVLRAPGMGREQLASVGSLHQGLLHVLDMGGGVIQEALPVAQIRPQRRDSGGRVKAASQETVGVKLLEPLRVNDVGFAHHAH